MPFLGPNCYGFINYLDGAALWPDQHGGQRVERGVAVVTQSGNIAVNVTMQQRSLPLAYIITLGNQAAVGIPECMEALLEDERVTAIGLHIEGISDLAAFERAALLALERRIPVVALKTGSSAAGAALAFSHTASLAGSDGLFNAIFDRLGIARARTVPELLETLKFLHVAGPLKGNRISSMSCSGGEASLMADLAEGRSVVFPDLAPAHKTEVQNSLGEMVHVSNPLDYHTYIWGDEARLTHAFTAMLRGDYDVSMVILDFPRGDRCQMDSWWPTVNAITSAAQTTGNQAAIVSSLGELLPEAIGFSLIEKGLAPMHGMTEALSAFEGAYRIGRAQDAPRPPRLLGGTAPSGTPRLSDEWESKRMLAAHGLTVPQGALVSSATEAVAAAEALGFPVAVKAVGPDIAHKTEIGGVALNLHNADAVDAAVGRMAKLAKRFLVEKMVTDSVAELIVGISRDPQFGPYLVVGFGGILVELIGDSRVLLLPTDRDRVRAALDSLKTAPLLKGYRGKPAADVEAAIDAIMAIAGFAEANADTIVELDVNPLMLRPKGKGVVAADALIRLAK